MASFAFPERRSQPRFYPIPQTVLLQGVIPCTTDKILLEHRPSLGCDGNPSILNKGMDINDGRTACPSPNPPISRIASEGASNHVQCFVVPEQFLQLDVHLLSLIDHIQAGKEVIEL